MKRIPTVSVLACLVTILLIGSCSKIDTTDLGNDLIPAIDNINTFETFLDVITDNKLFVDSTRMLDGEDHGVGIIENDPEFGKTVATTYASFTPASFKVYPFVKRDTVVIDSVVLSMGYTDVFGDSNSVQTFEVKEMETRFTAPFVDSLYFLSSPDFTVKTDLLGSANVNFHTLRDSTTYRDGTDTVRQGPELRMRLDTAWARQFVNFDTTGAYSSDSVFRKNFFAGIQIKASEASPNKNGIAYFDLGDNDRTRITFYCRVQNNGKTDTIAPFFAYYGNPHANLISRTPANAYLANVTNTTDNDEKLYIQSTPGSYATVKIPGLDTFALTNRVIHRAELAFDRFPSQDANFAPPAILFIDAQSTTGDSSFTIRNDFLPVSTTPGYDLNAIGGTLKNDQYVFNIARYLQSIVTQKFTNYTLKVYAPFTTQPYFIPEHTDVPANKVGIILNTPVAAGRVVLFGGGSTDAKRVRLRIIYSKI